MPTRSGERNDIHGDGCRCGASVVYEAGKRRSRVSGSKKLQVRTVAYRFVCCNLRAHRWVLSESGAGARYSSVAAECKPVLGL
jgi:hypothetical protein